MGISRIAQLNQANGMRHCDVPAYHGILTCVWNCTRWVRKNKWWIVYSRTRTTSIATCHLQQGGNAGGDVEPGRPARPDGRRVIRLLNLIVVAKYHSSLIFIKDLDSCNGNQRFSALQCIGQGGVYDFPFREISREIR